MDDPPKGQVCDRCRQKKIKCDRNVATSSCSNCMTADLNCEVSTKLRRNTKIRGHRYACGNWETRCHGGKATSTDPSTISRLERENAELRSQLQAEQQVSHQLRRELERKDQILPPPRPSKVRKVGEQSLTPQSPVVSLSGESDPSRLHRSSFVIKHMGRMVFDQWGVGRFAGSTTGVHFVASVEAMCRQAHPSSKPFPEDSFRMHLLQRNASTSSLANVDSDYPEDVGASSPKYVTSILPHSLGYYASQLDMFNDTWMAFCPILPRGQFLTDLRELVQTVKTRKKLNGKLASTLQALLAIMLINRLSLFDENLPESEDLTTNRTYLDLACHLSGRVAARGDLFSLQAMILFSFYLQLSEMTPWLIQINGLQLRLAQSLGLHRHARRFRFTDSETELRKRMWWWIYGFDKIASIVHGLPKSINDSDVDNDMPIDCELNDLGGTGLSHPLPGEPSPVVLYIHQINLYRILSSVLDQLYTTSQRRGGEDKIDRLDRELRNYYQNLNLTLQPSVMGFEMNDVERSLNKTRLQRFGENESYMIAWLDLMSNYAMVLIHRPALTFDIATYRFRESLNICLKSSSAIIRLADSSHFHRRMIGSAPFGAKIIFQSALMHTFYHCSTTLHSLDGTSIQRQDDSLMSKSISLLTDMEATPPFSCFHGRTSQQATRLLQSLSDLFRGSSQDGDIGEVTNISNIFEDTNQRFDQLDPTSSSIIIPHSSSDEPYDVGYWNTSALESLNHLDAIFGTWEDANQFIPPNIG